MDEITVQEVKRAKEETEKKTKKQSELMAFRQNYSSMGVINWHISSPSCAKCNQIWRTGDIPKDWCGGIIIPLPKKGDLRDCNKW